MKVVTKGIVHDQIYSESKHPNITIGREYLVLAIEENFYRILNDNRQPILYEKEIFDITDSHIPKNWVREDYGDGDYYIYPPELLSPSYFFEKYFDDVPEVVDAFNQYLKTLNL